MCYGLLTACLPVAADLVFAVSFASCVRANTMRECARERERSRVCVWQYVRAQNAHPLTNFRCRHPLCCRRRRRRCRSLRFYLLFVFFVFRRSNALLPSFSVFSFNFSLSDCDRIHSFACALSHSNMCACSFVRAEIGPFHSLAFALFQLNLLFCFIHAHITSLMFFISPNTLFNQQLVV